MLVFTSFIPRVPTFAFVPPRLGILTIDSGLRSAKRIFESYNLSRTHRGTNASKALN